MGYLMEAERQSSLVILIPLTTEWRHFLYGVDRAFRALFTSSVGRRKSYREQ
jgi:hypothetical protein